MQKDEFEYEDNDHSNEEGQYSQDLDDEDKEKENERALELKYSIGYNSAMTGAVHNLTTGKTEKRQQKIQKMKKI